MPNEIGSTATELRCGLRMKLEDKVCLITGAGRGIGEAIALAFARHGAILVLCSRTAKELQRTALKTTKAGSITVTFRVDVSDFEQISNMVEQTVSRFGRIDVLINNAGIYGPIGPIWKNDISLWRETIATNLFGPVHCIRAVVPHMIQSGGGKIVNVTGGGEGAFPRFSAYACSKSAMVRLTETLAEELREYNIQVNAIAPGAVNTRLLDEVLDAGINAGDFYEKAKRQKASGGVAPEKAARLAAFLASSDSGTLTGRLLSAVWDDWENLDIESIMDSSLYQVRRIDGLRFLESKQPT
jgi:3-oxoacyl-[acyl-carrier protein] reductase